MQSIIIPVDFTDRSQCALEYFVSIYSNTPIRIIILHAHSNLKSDEILISIDDIIEKDIRLKLEKAGRKLIENISSNQIELIFVAEKNDIISAISNVAKTYESDLLIIGSDGENSWTDIDHQEEGKTLKIIKEVSIPTIIIPTSNEKAKPNNVLFANLVNGITKTTEIEPLVELVKSSRAHLDVLHMNFDKSFVSMINRKSKIQIGSYIKDLKTQTHEISDQENYQAVNEFSKKHGIDLICISLRKISDLKALLKPAIWKKALLNGTRPILTLKIHAKS